MVNGAMSDPAEFAARIQELEIKAMEQQRLLEELSEGLFAQQRQMDDLVRKLQRLGQKVAENPGVVEGGGDDKPPHY
jgi:SlyX protein